MTTNKPLKNDNRPAICRIRLATEDDSEAIRAIDRHAWSGEITTLELLEKRHGILDGTPWFEQIPNDVATHLAQSDVTAFVAEQEGRVVGYAAAQIRQDPSLSEVGIVSYNAVHPDYRGQGIGTALINQVMNHLKEQGVRVLVVWTLEKDEPARRVYERLGFTELTRFVYYSMACKE